MPLPLFISQTLFSSFTNNPFIIFLYYSQIHTPPFPYSLLQIRSWELPLRAFSTTARVYKEKHKRDGDWKKGEADIPKAATDRDSQKLPKLLRITTVTVQFKVIKAAWPLSQSQFFASWLNPWFLHQNPLYLGTENYSYPEWTKMLQVHAPPVTSLNVPSVFYWDPHW